MKHYISALLVLMAVAITSCTKTIEIDYDEIDPLLVVQGDISDNGMRVYLNKTSNMTDTVGKAGLPGAVVTVTGSDGFEETFEYGDGVYYSPSNAVGVPGVTYKLHIVYEDKECTAESTMPERVDIDSVAFCWQPIINDIDIQMMKVYITDDPDVANYFYLSILRNNKTVEYTSSSDDGLTNFFNYISMGISSRNMIEDEADERKKTGIVKGDVLYAGDRIKVELRSCDYNFYHYLSTGSHNSDGVNPEGNIVGDGFLGSFSAYSTSNVEMVYKGLDQ